MKFYKAVQDNLLKPFKILKPIQVHHEGSIFRLHSTFTPFMLLLLSILLTIEEQFVQKGKPIHCEPVAYDLVKYSDELKKIINSYCWITTTYLLPLKKLPPGSFVAAPGMYTQGLEGMGEARFYAYYQWVSFFLFFQAFICFIPKYFWKRVENNLMKTIVLGLNMVLLDRTDIEKKQKLLVNYLIKHLNQHSYYTYFYWFAEFFCLLSLVIQMIFMDWFLNGEFRNYGLNVLALLEQGDKDPFLRTDSFIFLFPRLTRCTFATFGHSQSIQTYDVTCVLPLNNANEKIYIILWFWFIVLIFLSSLLFIFRSLIICLPKFRQILLQLRNRMVSDESIAIISTKVSVGDWWIFYTLAQNLDPLTYTQVTNEFANQHNAEMNVRKETLIL